MKCNSCQADISQDDLATLKLQGQVKCKFCRNIIVYDEQGTASASASCAICGGPLTADDIKFQGLTCRFCKSDYKEIETVELDYGEVRQSILNIPKAVIENAFNNALNEIDNSIATATRKQLVRQLQDARKQVEQLRNDYLGLQEDVKIKKKLERIKGVLVVLVKHVASTAGAGAIGGVAGAAIGALISIFGAKLLKKV